MKKVERVKIFRINPTKCILIKEGQLFFDLYLEVSKHRLKQVIKAAEFFRSKGFQTWIESAYEGVWLVIRLWEKVVKDGAGDV